MSNSALVESFDNGIGAIGNAWNVDTSVKGQVTLRGGAAMMEWAVGRDAGHGYGTYTVTAKLDGSVPGAGIVLWPGDNSWPGQEIDMAEIAVDGSGRHYGTVHWNNNGSDAFIYKIYDGVQGGQFHDYQMVWEPGKITFLVDGAVKGVIEDEVVPEDFDHGGMNNTIGFINTNDATSITVTQVDFTPLGGTASSQPSVTEQVWDVVEDVVAAAPAAPEAAAVVDWNAVAALVIESYEATGVWIGDVTAAAGAESPAAAETGLDDWNAIAEAVTENFETFGVWYPL